MIQKRHLRTVTLLTIGMALCLLASPAAQGFEFFNNAKWEPGLNSGSIFVGTPPNGPEAPGAASWSAGASGLFGDPPFANFTGPTTDIEFLITPAVDGLEYAIFDAAFEVWTEPARIDNLGQVADSGANFGALDAVGGHVGDIRVGAISFDGTANKLAQAFQPGTEAMYGAGGSIAGDIHFDLDEVWIDDPLDDAVVQDYDFFTIALHELGHALGLDHVAQGSGTVMDPFYTGSRRVLAADDIAGIRAIYGARMQGDIDKDDDVDIGGDILPLFSNFTGPNSVSGPTFGMRLVDGDVDFDDDVDVTDALLAFSNFTGPLDEGEGGLGGPAAAGDPNIPDLIYDATTGEVVLDSDGSSIIGYSLQNATNSFLPGAHTPILAGVTTALTSQIEEAALAPGSGSIGLVFPTGLDLAGLSALLTVNQVSRSLGAPLVPFDLVVVGGAPVPEPTTLLLAALGVVGLVALSRRRLRRRAR